MLRKAVFVSLLLGVWSVPSVQAFAVPLTGTAGQTLNVEVTKVGTFAGLGGSYDAWQVNLHVIDPADRYDYVWGMDLSIIPGAASELHQSLYEEWNAKQKKYITHMTPTQDEVDTWLGTDAAVDTHFSLRANQMTPAQPDTAAAEDNDRSFGLNGLDDTEGRGTYLSVTAALTADAAQELLPLAYVVVPAGGAFLLTGDAADGRYERWTFGPKGVGGVLIPEPAMLSLLAMGGLAVMRRRRR